MQCAVTRQSARKLLGGSIDGRILTSEHAHCMSVVRFTTRNISSLWRPSGRFLLFFHPQNRDAHHPLVGWTDASQLLPDFLRLLVFLSYQCFTPLFNSVFSVLITTIFSLYFLLFVLIFLLTFFILFLNYLATKMMALRSVRNHATQCNVFEDVYLQQHRGENFKCFALLSSSIRPSFPPFPFLPVLPLTWNALQTQTAIC